MKKFLALLLAVLTVFSIAACGKAPPTQKATQPQEIEVEGAGTMLDNSVSTGRTNLNYAFSEAIVSADPHANTKAVTTTLYNWVYNGLVFADGKGNVSPDLAESYKLSDDGMSYVFQIRQDVKFHNGDQMTADDVVFSLNRCIEMTYYKNYTSSIESVEKTGDWEVTIKLKSIDNGFLYNLYPLKIVSQKIVEAEGENFGNGAQFAGTGPYVITDYDPNTLIKFKKYEDYHGECGNIETINAYIITNATTRATALQTGELDVIEVPSSYWEEINSSGNFNTELLPAAKIIALIISNGKAEGEDQTRPQIDKRVRQAMYYAIDRDALVSVGKNGLGKKAYIIPNPEYVIGADETEFVGTYEYNPEKAKELLAEAGYADGCDVGIFLVPNKGDLEKIATMVVGMWSAVGINATIEMQESATASALSKEHYQGVYITDSTYVHHMSNMKRAMHQASWKTSVAKYGSDELDAYFDNAQQTTDEAIMLENYQNVNRFVNEEAINVPLFYEVDGYAWVQGLNTTFTEDVYYCMPQHWYWS